MHFENDTKEDLEELINSESFKKIEISKVIAEALIEKCRLFGLENEIKIVEAVTLKTILRH